MPSKLLRCFCSPSKDLLVSRRLASAHGLHTTSNARGPRRRQSASAPLVPVRCRRRARASVKRCHRHGQTLAFRMPRDLLVDEPAAFIELLEAARPARVSMEDMGAILRALPPQGEVTKLGAPAQRKVDAVRQLLTATRRDWYEIKVIDLPQAGMALHARAVVLIPAPTIALLSGAELQAMVAHEIGHEYVWTEWNRAHQHADRERLKELELVCDVIAAVRRSPATPQFFEPFKHIAR